MNGILCAALVAGLSCPALAQLDVAQKGADKLASVTEGKLKLQFEERTRWEEQDGVKFWRGGESAGHAEPAARGSCNIGPRRG